MNKRLYFSIFNHGQFFPDIFALYMFDTAGNFLGMFPNNGLNYHIEPYCMAVNPDGSVYLGGKAHAQTGIGFPAIDENYYRSVCLVSQEGYEIPTPIHHYLHDVYALILAEGGAVYLAGEAIDDDGNPWTGGYEAREGYVNFRKVNADGSTAWAVDLGHGSAIPNLWRDSSNNVYVAINANYEGKIYKFNSSGVVQFYNHSTNYAADCVAVRDSNKHVYVGQYRYDPNGAICNLCHYDNDGNFVASVLIGDMNPIGFEMPQNRFLSIEINENFIYVSAVNRFYQLDFAMAVVEERFSFFSPIMGFAVDNDNECYLTHFPDGGFSSASDYYRLMRFDLTDANWTNESSAIWAQSFNNGPSLGLTRLELATVDTPSLPLPLALAGPTWEGDRYTHAPSLPLPLALSVPTWIREFMARYAPPTIYRAIVQKSPLANWPARIASISLRRDSGQTTVSLVCPSMTLDDLTAFEARMGGDLIVYRGLRFPDGLEQLDELVRVVFTGGRYDSGANRRSLTLEGSIATPAANPKTRMARGISYRNQSANGRQVRCDVDTWLRPGDQLDLGGGEFLTVDSIACAISPSSATMDVIERLL